MKTNINIVHIIIIVGFVLMVTNLFSQTIDTSAWDGRIYVKIYDGSNQDFLQKDSTECRSNFPSDLHPYDTLFGLTKISKPFIKYLENLKMQKTYLFEFTNLSAIEEFIHLLNQIPYVEYAEKVPYNKVFCTSEASGYWSSTPETYHLNLVQACNAWSITGFAANNFVIAIVDNEIQMNHPDLINKITSTSFDVANNDANTTAPASWTSSHGTHASGIAGAENNNGIGVAGLGGGAGIMAIKATKDNAPSYSITDGYQGILYAVQHHADIISISWGGSLSSLTEQNIINIAFNSGSVIIASAGNNIGNAYSYPAAYNNVVSVGATNQSDIIAPFSATGTWIDIMAPGVSIWSSVGYPSSGYAYVSGTSMSCPMVAGICALIKSVNPNLSPAGIVNCLLTSADNISGGRIRVNANSSVLCAQSSLSQNIVGFNSQYSITCPGQSVSFFNQSNVTGSIISYSWSFSCPVTYTGGTSSNTQNPIVIFPNTGTCDVTLTITTSTGTYSSTINNCITVSNLTCNISAVSTDVCIGSLQQVNINFNGDVPPYSAILNYNGINYTVQSFEANTEFYYTVVQGASTIMLVSASGLSCFNNTSQTIVVNVSYCCNNSIVNGDFSSGNTGFTSSMTYGPIWSYNCWGYYYVDAFSGVYNSNYYSVPSYPNITNKGINLNIIGPGPTNPSPVLCPNPYLLPSTFIPLNLFCGTVPGNGEIIWKQTGLNLVSNTNYHIDFYTTQGNLPSFLGYPVLPLQFRVEIFQGGVPVYTSPVLQTPYTTHDSWQQHSLQWNSGAITAGNYDIQIEQFENFSNNHDFFRYLVDDISVRGEIKDLYIKDSPEDIGSETNVETYNAMGVNFWSSPDVWIRQTNDGLTNQFSEPIEYMASTPNYIYVRVKNRGCSPQTANLRVYWASAGTGLGWPVDWVNNTTTYPGCSATIYGNEITPSTSITVPGQSEQIYVIPWQPNNPDNYSCFLDPFHFCLLARIETSSTPPYGMTFPEGTSVWANTKDNNNIAWKNIIINNDIPGMVRPFGTSIIRNTEEKTRFIKLNFVSKPDDIGQDLSKFKSIRLFFTKDLIKRWAEGGKRGKDIVLINDSVIEVTSSNATMEHIFLRYNEIGSVSLSLLPKKEPVLSNENYFNFDIVQYSEEGKVPQGGVTYQIKKGILGKDCYASATTLNGVITSNQTFSDSILVTGNILVPNGFTLKFEKAIVLIDENIQIRVMPGGKLIINSSELISSCIGKKWAGIEVKGNPVFVNPLTITNSVITGSDFTINLDKSKDILISGSAFIGDNIGIAIMMNKMKDFLISGNTFVNYEIGIKTTNTCAADVKSGIEKNIFFNVRKAIEFTNDNHSKLDIKCNRFSYTDYAILSNQTILKDQGQLGEGAGNEFTSNSTLANNKLKHINGNSPKYYFDPSQPINNGMNVTTIASITDRICYSYSFDTSSTVNSQRIAPADPIQKSINKKVVDVYSVPNPNSGKASIYYSLGEEMIGELVVMDIFGKVIDRITLFNESNKVDVDYSEYASGIYMISLTNSKGEMLNKKMIITK